MMSPSPTTSPSRFDLSGLHRPQEHRRFLARPLNLSGAPSGSPFRSPVRPRLRAREEEEPLRVRESFFQMADRNGDGWIDAEEWQQYSQLHPELERYTGHVRLNRNTSPYYFGFTVAYALEGRALVVESVQTGGVLDRWNRREKYSCNEGDVILVVNGKQMSQAMECELRYKQSVEMVVVKKIAMQSLMDYSRRRTHGIYDPVYG